MQVGNFTLERATWQRPEEMHTRRPVYYVATKNGAQPPGQRALGSGLCGRIRIIITGCQLLVHCTAALCLQDHQRAYILCSSILCAPVHIAVKSLPHD